MLIRSLSGVAAAFVLFPLTATTARAQEPSPAIPKPTEPAVAPATPTEKAPTPPVAQAAKPTTPLLSIGSVAPPLPVAEWVKGKPVVIAPGTITVIDFWATWCLPCRPALAKSSVLAKKYAGKVQFAAISVSEQTRPSPPVVVAAKVKQYVTEMGDRMDFPVGRDTADDAIQNTWLVPSGIETIPLAFIVDKDGKIAWVGNPMVGMEESLEKIIAGTYNRELAIQAQATEREYRVRQRALNARLDELYAPVLALARAKKFPEAVAEMDKVTAANPDYANLVAILRYRLLVAHDEAGAQKFAAEMLTTGWKDDPGALDSAAWSIVAPDSPFKKPDYALATRLAETAVALSSEGEPGFLETLAVAYQRQGDLDKAIATGNKAVAQFATDDNSEMAKAIRARITAMKAKRDADAKKPK
ncbi:MAG: redoxin domain-containing protein [Fibrella sp.]|nr:redoxin domain-containing protein [Armatimonadota bacterium]